jgi:predicted phage tail protein
MLRNVYLDGELGEKYGSNLKMRASSVADVFKCIAGNDPKFQMYLKDCTEKNIGFMCEVQGTPLKDDRELLLNFREGDMYISPQPMGSKSGGAKIFAAIVAAALIYVTGGFVGGAGGWAVNSAGAVSGWGAAAISATAGLALTGIQQMMLPDPSTDTQDESYLFQGSGQTMVEGDPVPLLYGELRIPGRPVSMVVRNQGGYFYNDSVPGGASPDGGGGSHGGTDNPGDHGGGNEENGDMKDNGQSAPGGP